VFTVFVTVDVHPDRVEKFLRAITTNAEASLRDEPGCLAFDVHRDERDQRRYYFYEVYADENAFMNGHCSSSHYADWQAAAKDVVVDGSTQLTHACTIHFGSAGR
jgi:(4S)-4-hydroxy-5-phosphonooxypentane-2,3-dione isomerase